MYVICYTVTLTDAKNYHMLPTLLEEIQRPASKSMQTFCDYIHRWRCFIFQQWKPLTVSNVSDEHLGMAVDRLIGIVLLLEHCKRYGYFDLTLSQFTDSWNGGTLGTFQENIVNSISCPILKKVFATELFENVILPRSFLDNRGEQRIRNALWLLLRDSPIPLWLFGDYHQLCVANPHGKAVERKRSSQVRYARGIHYTPAPIVDYLTATILRDEDMSNFPGVLDPSCGCGSFLIAVFRYLVEKRCQNESAINREQVVLETLQRSLFGVDIDSQAIDWTIRLLYLESKRLIGGENCHLPVPDISCNIITRSFFNVESRTFGGRIKTILGGPPFVRYRELVKNQSEFVKQLRTRFISSKTGQFDLYMPFIEHAVNLLDDGNKIGFSLSNSFLRTDAGKETCRFLLDCCSPLEVLEFSGGDIYPDAAVQIVLLRLAVGKSERGRGRYVALESTPDIRAPLEQIFVSHSLPDRMGKITLLEENELISTHASEIPFVRSNKIDAIRFDDLPVKFIRGAASKSDDIFMLKDHGTNFSGIRIGMTRRLKEAVRCESNLTIPIIRGREIKGFQYSPVKYFYLAPYIDGNMLDWRALEENYPLAFQYLMRFHESFVQKGMKEWHAYHTPPVYYPSEVIVSCKIAPTRSFARMELSDKTIHGSAFGIIVDDSRMDKHLFLLYLNSTYFWHQLEATMPPMGVSHRAIRMSILKNLLIPRLIAYPTDESVLAARKLVKRINQIVGRGKSEEIKSIFTELDSFVESVVL